ncbi:MAG TPA: maleylpyruvate isomerase family mycothiol-dependent enzyme [Trebonia sp.]|nr:maleylpyruvate isomerase family mycothiol-dependent enzyme [Trebonia sp.]
MADALEHEWFIDRTAAEIDRLAWLADGADPALPVPSCPGWVMAKLVKHTGIVHRWATEIVATRSSDRIDMRALDAGLPAKESDYAGWLTSGAEPLARALRGAGPEAEVWTWGAPRTSGWWARRLLHETTVHRADAEIAAGTEPDIDPVAAADGIDEFLANLPAARRPSEHLGSLPSGESLHLHATDSDGEWLIRITEDGIGWERGHAKATAAVRAPVGSLLLFTYGRLSPGDDRLTVFGDESLLTAWQERTAL